MAKKAASTTVKGSTLTLEGSSMAEKAASMTLKGSALTLKGSSMAKKAAAMTLKGSSMAKKAAAVRVGEAASALRGAVMHQIGARVGVGGARGWRKVCRVGCRDFRRSHRLGLPRRWSRLPALLQEGLAAAVSRLTPLPQGWCRGFTSLRLLKTAALTDAAVPLCSLPFKGRVGVGMGSSELRNEGTRPSSSRRRGPNASWQSGLGPRLREDDSGGLTGCGWWKGCRLECRDFRRSRRRGLPRCWSRLPALLQMRRIPRRCRGLRRSHRCGDAALLPPLQGEGRGGDGVEACRCVRRAFRRSYR